MCVLCPLTLTSLSTSFLCGSYACLQSKKETVLGIKWDKNVGKGVSQNFMVCWSHHIKIHLWALTPAQAVSKVPCAPQCVPTFPNLSLH